MSLRVAELFSVEGKVALVTGGATGIGRMISQGLVENGATVYIASRKADVCKEAAAELSKLGRCIAIPTDVSDIGRIQDLARSLRELTGRLDILVNNAGTGWDDPLKTYSPEGWDKVFDVNLRGPFYVMSSMLPLLRASAKKDDPARVVNIGSISGIMESPDSENRLLDVGCGTGYLLRSLANRCPEAALLLGG